MEWLTLWLKKIILLVLLAAFLDLILPNTNMQKYVKMVMGLIILITLISPVFSLFNMSQEDLALRLDRYQQEMVGTKDAELQSLTSKLVGHQHEQITQYVQKQMEAAIRAQVKNDFGLEVSNVQVSLKANEATPEQGEIETIKLTLGGREQEGKAISGITPIEPIQPVEINLQKSDHTVHSNGTEAREVNGRVEKPINREIARSVAKQWNVRPDQVNVNDESDQGRRQ